MVSYGMWMRSCSSASLSSSGLSLSRSAHVFFTMAVPPCGVDSKNKGEHALPHAQGKYSSTQRVYARKGANTIESVDMIKVNLSVEQ